MQIVYITGSTYSQVIKKAAEDVLEDGKDIVLMTEISDEVDLRKYIKNNIVNLDGVDKIIIDFSVCKNTDEEILEGLEMLRTVYDELQIIVFAPYLITGNELLRKCFNMGIWNIVNTDDFKEIRDEIMYCLSVGKKYKDAAIYKDAKPEMSIKHEIKKTVNNHTVGVAGTQARIGTTHTSVMLANFFRKKGFMVALVEMNNSQAFEAVRDGFEEKKYEEGYFTLGGVDFYENANEKTLFEIMERSYNFIIMDFGEYEKCDLLTFHKCNQKMIVAGSKPWEIESVNKVFEIAEQEVLKNYIFYFNFSLEREQQDIRNGMSVIKNVHFLNIENDPFSSYGIPDAEEVFAEFLPEQIPEEKKGILKRGLLKKGKKDEKN